MSIQTKETIEFSRNGGIKITYLRFLADSAPGFLFILACVFLFYYLEYLQIYCIPPITIDEKVKIGILILLLLLATPLGLAINAVSCIFLGWLEQLIAKYFMRLESKRNILAGSSRYEYAFDRYRELYSPQTITNPNDPCKLYEYSKQYEILLSVYFPAYHMDTAHISGLTQFTRSVAFMALCLGVIFYVIKINHEETISNLNYSAAFLIASPIIFISLFFLIIILVELIPFKKIIDYLEKNAKKCESSPYNKKIIDFLIKCSNFLDKSYVFILVLFGIVIPIGILFCIGTNKMGFEMGFEVLYFIFFSIFFLFIFTAGFVEFYTSIKVLAYVHALIDRSHRWKYNYIVDYRLKEITEYLIREGKK